MAYEQYFTTCKRCGRKILMTVNQETRKMIPCEPELHRFSPGGGPETYVTPDGIMKRGVKDYNGEPGYRKHLKNCKEKKNG